jgi:2-keto-4-pentenoate hydratase
MDPRAAQDAAALLWALWQEQRTIAELPERCRPATLEQGWVIQRTLDDLAGEHAGWKIAATSPAGQRSIGADGPVIGRLYDPIVVPSGTELVAEALTMRLAEAEFAFRMADDLPLGERPFSREQVLDAVASMHPAIEVPDSRFDDFTTVGLPSLIGDAMCGAFLVIGPPAPAWDPLALPGHPVVMRRDGAEIARGAGANVLGDPCEALVWVANELRHRGHALRAGDVVTTGACTPPNGIAAGDALVADFGALGTVEVRFAAAG